MIFQLFLKALLFAAMLMLTFAAKVDEKEQAANDFYMGMAGLKEAASNPAMLAQLMQDLQVRTPM